MIDDFCDDADEWKQIADSYAYELEYRDARIDELQARVKQLEAALEDALQYVSRADWHYLKDETHKALEGKDE